MSVEVHIWHFLYLLFLVLFTSKADVNEPYIDSHYFWIQVISFSIKHNILPSAKWLQCHLPGRERQGGFFPLPSRVIPVKKVCDSSCRMTQALMVFLESSHNQFNMSDPKTNVSFCLQHHQQFSKLWLLFHMPCKRFRELSTG